MGKKNEFIDIYLIENLVNGKVYIGQSADVYTRWCSHKGIGDLGSLVDRTIKEEGVENFDWGFLEKGLTQEEANEKERYWISFYDSTNPEKGYNIQTGGKKGGKISSKSNYVPFRRGPLSLETIKQIQRDWLETNLTSREIGRKNGVSKETALRINAGDLHRDGSLCYPLRTFLPKGSKLTQEQNREVHELLKYTFLCHSEIAKLYNVEKTVILKIERGERDVYRLPTEEYPLRDYKSSGKPAIVTYDQVTEVIDLLLNTPFSLREIERITGVNYNMITSIKSGRAKRFRRKGLTYPLRENGFTTKTLD